MSNAPAERRRGPHIMLVAGEPSGDLLGASLMARLRDISPQVRFSGVGAAHMQAQGLETLFPLSDIAVFGAVEILPRIPLLLRRIHQTVRAVRQQQPDALVMIDAPGFNFTVARRLKRAGDTVPRIHYAAPTVWAWRPERAKMIAGFLDHLMTLLPFEPPYFEREGLPCTFVGHPVVESGAGGGNAERLRQRLNLSAEGHTLVVLPGSRRSELKRLLPVFAETMARLKNERLHLDILLPTLPEYADSISTGCASWPVRVHVLTEPQDKWDAFAAGTVALAASGTVALELALAGLPAVIAYKISPLTYALYRRLITAKYVSLPNIMHDRRVQPELLQQECTPEKLTQALSALLGSPALRQTQKDALRDVGAWLGAGTAQTPSQRAAACVQAVMSGRRV